MGNKKLSKQKKERLKIWTLARLKGLKPFYVSWQEDHAAQVWARDEDEAYNLALEAEDTFQEVDHEEIEKIPKSEFLEYDRVMANDPEDFEE